MKTLFIGLVLLTAIQLNGQDTKKKTISVEKPKVEETFFVLESNEEIKHGEYLKSYGGHLIKGQFDHNKRVGVWEYIDRDGQLGMRIDFDSSKVIFRKPFNFIRKFVNPGDSLKEFGPEEEPVFLGGRGPVFFFLFGLTYPVEARRKGIEGEVLISATITNDGRIINERLEQGVDPVLDNEALSAVKRIPDEWLPGQLNGEVSDVKILIPVKFNLR